MLTHTLWLMVAVSNPTGSDQSKSHIRRFSDLARPMVPHFEHCHRGWLARRAYEQHYFSNLPCECATIRKHFMSFNELMLMGATIHANLHRRLLITFAWRAGPSEHVNRTKWT